LLRSWPTIRSPFTENITYESTVYDDAENQRLRMGMCMSKRRGSLLRRGLNNRGNNMVMHIPSVLWVRVAKITTPLKERAS